MRFTVKRERFLKGLNVAARAISSKVAMPVLENFKIELTDRGLFITGSNLDFTIKTQVPFKSGEEEIIRNYKEGVVLVEAKKLTNFVNRVDSEEVTLDIIDSTVAVVYDNNASNQRLSCIRPEEYLDIDLEATGEKLTLAASDFNNLVNQTAFAASVNERQRPVLTALNLEASNSTLTATATDTFRLARKVININSQANFVANVPAKMMIEVSRMLEGCDSIDIAVSDKKALFTIGTTVVATRLIGEDYPSTKNIVPRMTNYTLEVNAADLIHAIDIVSSVFDDGKNTVKLSMSEDSVVVSTKSSNGNTSDSKINIFKYVGSDLEILFNSDRVIAAVKALACTDVTLAFVAEMRPFVVENALDDSVVQVVTPNRY